LFLNYLDYFRYHHWHRLWETEKKSINFFLKLFFNISKSFHGRQLRHTWARTCDESTRYRRHFYSARLSTTHQPSASSCSSRAHSRYSRHAPFGYCRMEPLWYPGFLRPNISSQDALSLIGSKFIFKIK
jgi:hypothetical protein